MTHGPDVLVVDDDVDMAETVQLLLEDAGLPTRIATNGREALALVERHRPAVVLMDMLMPVMDGWTCARELRARYGRTLPIVVLTAAEHVRARVSDLDVDEVLPKPFEIDQLVGVVARFLRPEQGATR